MARELRWADDEQGFLAELSRGRKAEMTIAVDLLARGFGVKVGGLFLREEKSDDFSEQADITLDTGIVLEVKSRSIKFSTPQDYPYKTAFVCAVKRWDKRRLRPHATLLMSEKTGAVLVVPTSTEKHWTQETIFDRHRGHPETCYSVAKSHLKTWEWYLEALKHG